jgi:hypothetical protein
LLMIETIIIRLMENCKARMNRRGRKSVRAGAAAAKGRARGQATHHQQDILRPRAPGGHVTRWQGHLRERRGEDLLA